MQNFKKLLYSALTCTFLLNVNIPADATEKEVRVYSGRHYNTDRAVFKRFAEEQKKERTDLGTNGTPDKGRNERTDGRTNGRPDIRRNEKGGTNERMNRGTDEGKTERKNERTDGRMYAETKGQRNERTD